MWNSDVLQVGFKHTQDLLVWVSAGINKSCQCRVQFWFWRTQTVRFGSAALQVWWLDWRIGLSERLRMTSYFSLVWFLLLSMFKVFFDPTNWSTPQIQPGSHFPHFPVPTTDAAETLCYSAFSTADLRGFPFKD